MHKAAAGVRGAMGYVARVSEAALEGEGEGEGGASDAQSLVICLSAFFLLGTGL